MKKQDTEDSATKSSEDAPPAAEGMEPSAAAKDSLDSNRESPKESELQTPQTDTPPRTDEAESQGKIRVVYKVNSMLIVWLPQHLYGILSHDKDQCLSFLL